MRTVNEQTVSFLSLCLGALVSDTASAQSLEERIRELERRVGQLEQQIQQQPASGGLSHKEIPARAAAWRNIENWRALRRGMTEDDVRSILGKPHKVDAGSFLILWYYDYPGGGSVRFSTSNSLLEAWTEPAK